jgi:hypothetical protein
MTGPYTAAVYLDPAARREPDLVLDFAEMYYTDGKGEVIDSSPGFSHKVLSEPAKLASRFYRDGAGATLRGTTNLAVFYVGALLAPGEEASIEIVGRHGGEPATGASETVRRDEAGRLFSTLGSRFNERHFVGA